MNRLIYSSEIINQGITTELLEIKFSNSLNQLRRINVRKLLQFFRLVIDLISKIREFRPDYIYFSLMPVGKGFWRDIVFVIIIKTFRIRTIYHLHNRGISRNSRKFAMKRIYRFVFRDSFVIHNSYGLMSSEIDELKVRGLKRVIVPNGVKDKKPEKINGNGKINLLFLSNLFPGKGMIELVDMFNELARKYDNIHLNIVGGFPYAETQNTVVRKINDLGLESRISLLGAKYGKQKIKEFQRAHLFVFPTSFRQECFPLVLLEAMNFGLPVVTSDEGAIPEIFENGVDGFVISLDKRIEFIKKIEDLILDKKLREEVGSKARKNFLDKYTDELVEQRMRDFFEKEILN